MAFQGNSGNTTISSHEYICSFSLIDISFHISSPYYINSPNQNGISKTLQRNPSQAPHQPEIPNPQAPQSSHVSPDQD